MKSDATQRAVQAVESAMPWLGRSSRRDLLRVGALALAGSMPLGRMLGSRQVLAADATPSKLPPTAKSVIFLWMAGGVTHHDSFDPKPEAPEKVRGTLATISTRLPGVHFTEVMPRCAEIADKLA